MLAAALLIPFVVAAPDHQHLVLESGSLPAYSGRRALHVHLDSGPEQALRSAVYQRVPAPVPGHLRAEVRHRGRGQGVTITLKCFDAQGHLIAQQSKRARPSASNWRTLRGEAAPDAHCRSAELWLASSGPATLSFDDAALFDSSGKNLLTNAGFEDGWKGWRQGDAADHAGTLWVNDTPFVPWGLNYDRTILGGKDILLEEAPLHKIDRDFLEARRIGANSIRLFLQVGYFMPTAKEVDETRLRFLDQVVLLARRRNLRVDLTGLSHIDAANVPAWYIHAAPEELLEGQALFWETIARRYANEPAIFLFNLQNEPYIASDGVRKPFGCFSMSGGRKFCYVNPQPRSSGPERWARTLVEAIRRHSKRHLVTIGLLPTATPVFGGGNPGFSVPAVAPLLDVIAIHLYPDRKARPEEFLDVNQAWLEMVLRYSAGFGKPVIVEEWFPLFPEQATAAGPADWFPRFLQASLGSVCGWLTFYHALLVDGAGEKQPYPTAHIELFAKHAEEMRNLVPQRKPATAILRIDPAELWRNHDKVRDVLADYRRQRAAGHTVDFASPER